MLNSSTLKGHISPILPSNSCQCGNLLESEGCEGKVDENMKKEIEAKANKREWNEGTRGRRKLWHTSESQRSQGGDEGSKENDETGKDTIRKLADRNLWVKSKCSEN